MKYNPYFLIALCSFLWQSCNQINSQVEKREYSKTIWQLDYYPDSIIANKDIFHNSKWNSSYAYNINFSKDSCQFIGWHEGWWNHLSKVNENEYKTIDDDSQFWEFKFDSNEKLFMREVNFRKKNKKYEYGEYYPYHKVKTTLTLDSLNYMIAKEVFSGTYKVIFNDIFNCNKEVKLKDNFNLIGIKNISKYGFETEIDCDLPIPNVFRIYMDNNQVTELSFKFNKDTLFLKEFKRIDDSVGDFDHFDIRKSRIILKKNK